MFVVLAAKGDPSCQTPIYQLAVPQLVVTGGRISMYSSGHLKKFAVATHLGPGLKLFLKVKVTLTLRARVLYFIFRMLMKTYVSEPVVGVLNRLNTKPDRKNIIKC